MKTRKEAENILLDELNIWFQIQSEYLNKDFYLYYLPSTNEHDGKLVIAENNPLDQEYKLAMPDKIQKFSSVETNYNWIKSHILGSLPILS